MIANFLHAVKTNKVIVYNYSLMTFVQFLNSFFYIIIFPVVINRIGVEGYGLFVYTTSFCLIITTLINYGYDILGLRGVSLSLNCPIEKSSVFSNIFLCKLLAMIAVSAVFVSGIFLWVENIENKILFFVCYLNCISAPFYVNWFYQSVQKMVVPAIFQVLTKLGSLPFILIFVQEVDDTFSFALIVNLSNFIFCLASFVYVFYNFEVRLSGIKISRMRDLTIEGIPFFLSNVTNAIKQRSVEILLGSFFGVKAVAVYDLANKVYSIPSLIATNLNAAIFPRLANNKDKLVVNKIIQYEVFFCIIIVSAIAIFGGFAVNFLSAGNLSESYFVLILLSLNIFAYLIVGCYIYFVFVPRKMYSEILRIQVVATACYGLGAFCAIAFGLSFYYILIALVISGIVEIAYSIYLSINLDC